MIEYTDLEKMLPPGLIDAMSQAAVDEVLANIMEAARAEWIRIAGAELFGTRRDYINGIQPVQFKPGQGIISLVGELPNIVEHGMERTDMHDTLLGRSVPTVPPGQRGKHRKQDRSGYYRAIPFRHATPGSGGASGQPMGRAYSEHEAVEDSRKLGKEVYAAAKKLSATKSEPYGGVGYGGRLPAGMAPKLKEHHAVDIYAGMVRAEKKYKKATQSQYVTFRTISTDSPGWIRPSTLPGKQYSQRVVAFINKIAVGAFQAYVEGVG
jgi:hypothetical protein